MLKLVTIVGRVVLGASGLLLTGCAYDSYHRGHYDGPAYRGYYERTDYRYGERHDRYYDRDGRWHRVRYSDRYERCD